MGQASPAGGAMGRAYAGRWCDGPGLRRLVVRRARPTVAAVTMAPSRNAPPHTASATCSPGTNPTGR